VGDGSGTDEGARADPNPNVADGVADDGKRPNQIGGVEDEVSG